MSKKKIDKTPLKRQQWVERTALTLGISTDEARRLLSTPRQQSLRINPLKGDLQETLTELRTLGWEGNAQTWCGNGYTNQLPIDQLRDSSAVTDGRVFIQNAASWLPVLALDAKPGELILDVCAAPGGKTSHIAATTGNQAHIWANDNSRARLAKLQANMKRLGVSIDQYTLFDATALACKLGNRQFDKVLLDAPCSGEGLMQLDSDKDFTTWSVAHIKRLQQLQKRILSQAWQLLKPGGILIYSTCTIAPEENEAVVDYLLRQQEDVSIMPFELKLPNRVQTVKEWNGRTFSPVICDCMRLIPSEDIEAFFVCKLKKLAS